eukprot:CAMPEP_0196756830 /NCGR_PEP_ID=MMETSP1091-20130531/102324_1 /TAXON_ID=302021 /ORGANISM="Rhodomonas sp., Strain CCMP768" /LENGTH=136 /DNA_ID=CAMNT_0042105511 /DNA_START=320 /DNA_END=730 /DNA_ORIENTATION=+
MPLRVAAKSLGVGVTVFKKACRSLGVRQWPYRFQEFLPESTQAMDAGNDAPIAIKEEQETVNFPSEVLRDGFHKGEESVKVEQAETEELRVLLAHSRKVWGETEGGAATQQNWLHLPLEAEGTSSLDYSDALHLPI